MTWPTISIVMPSFNQVAYLERSLRSVLRQDYPRLEFLVIDGGSTDGSVEILRRYDQEITYWVSEPDGGQADAINKGLRLATGDIVSWLNSDDLHCRDTLHFVGRWFQDSPTCDALYGGTLMVDERDRVIDAVWPTPPDPEYLFYIGFDVSQQALFWRREWQLQHGLLDPDLQFSMDYDFLLRLFTSGRIAWTSQFLGVFRRHRAAKSSNQIPLSHVENERVRLRFQDRFPFAASSRIKRWECRLRRFRRLITGGAGRYMAYKFAHRCGWRLSPQFWLDHLPGGPPVIGT